MVCCASSRRHCSTALELTQDIEGEQSACLRALQMLKELNATGRRKLPEDAPTDFLSQRLKPIVINQGEIDRRAWECALLIKLRDELKAGNLSVRYSKRFARLEEFFIDDRRWQGMREDFFRRSGLPSDSKQVPEYLARRLAEAYERFLKTAPSNSYAVVDKDAWRLSAESTEEHYTDTHGYTEINFAAFAMLGLRFCPRIRESNTSASTGSIPTATTER